ncbi:MAG: hypothetical protein ACD_75C00938G0006 [uncultured bacterium]|nr:MAG: hypothetical protein ACD_75C00938G0006 [uncultured bacterium]
MLSVKKPRTCSLGAFNQQLAEISSIVMIGGHNSLFSRSFRRINHLKALWIDDHCFWGLNVLSRDNVVGTTGYELLRTSEGDLDMKLQSNNSFIINKSLMFTAATSCNMA